MKTNKKSSKKSARASFIHRYTYTVQQFKKRTNFVGILLGAVWFMAALTPSLVPRPWFLQGLAAGISLVLGYFIGTGLSVLWRRFVRREPKPVFKKYAWVLLSIWVLVAPAYELGQSVLYQQKLTVLIGDTSGSSPSVLWVIFGTLIVTVLVATILFRVFLFLHRLYVRVHGYFLQTWIIKKVPKAVYRTVIALVAATAVTYLATDAGLRFSRDAVSNFFKTGNMAVSEKYQKPASPLLSGSDDSLVSWESLGAPGRQFVAAPPTLQQLQDFHGATPAQQPIRAYVGIDASANIREQARLAVKELERTNAFDRQVIQIVSTTGSGGVDLSATRPLEYMYAGDVATVAIQYSYFPSWLSLVTDRERAKSAALELTNQIYAAREKHLRSHASAANLYVFGESLGSYGIEAAYPTTDKLFDRADKALLVGPPGFNPIREGFSDSGRQDDAVAFIDAVTKTSSKVSEKTRLAYLENPTDPVTKWDPELIWHQPDWLEEQRKLSDDRFEWQFGVSFIQVTVDMILSLDVPVGYGHRYGVETSRVWAELVRPPDWNMQKQQKLEDTLRSFYF